MLSVESLFGDIKLVCFYRFQEELKNQFKNVINGKMYLVCALLTNALLTNARTCALRTTARTCALLTNARTCAYGHMTSKYFDCEPPSLDVKYKLRHHIFPLFLMSFTHFFIRNLARAIGLKVS